MSAELEYTIIYIWPDDTWRWANEYSEVNDNWKGEDYRTVSVPATLLDDQVEILIAEGKV